jgi:RNA polymerase sigma factor (sigma-70 family)
MNSVRDRQAAHRRPSGRLHRLDVSPVGDDTGTWGGPHPRASGLSPSAHAEADERVELIRAALDKIADEVDHRIVHLCFFEGISLRDVAERLHLNREDVRQRFHTAMRFLEQELEGLR